MRTIVPVLLLSSLVVSGCSTRANPFNWFGGDGDGAAAVAVPVERDNPLIPERAGLFSGIDEVYVYPGFPVDTVTGVAVERVPGGIIVRATGRAAVQGVYDVRLIPANEDELPVEGVMTYTLEAVRSQSNVAGAPATRDVIVARKVSDQTLAGTRTIRVEGLQNAQTARR